MTTLNISFGATSTTADVLAGVDLSGKRAIVTGASSGIGAETVRALARAGAEVTLAVRDVEVGAKVAREIGTDRVRVERLDLSDQASVADFVTSWRGPLHILVCNAGVMATPELRTAEGWEAQIATNHLGHFALALGLHIAMKATGNARIVVVSSVGHVNGDVDFDDLMFERRPYDPWTAYGQSKTANILFMVDAARRWKNDGITVNALNPGRIASTRLGRHIAATPPPASFEPNSKDVSNKNVEQGAATSALLAGSPLVEGITGTYFEDCAPAAAHTPGVRRGVAAYALEPSRAARLWEVSTALIDRAARTRRQPRLVDDADHLALERLIIEAAWRVDDGRSDTLHDLFTEDGALTLGSTVLTGRQAIRAWGRQLEDARTYRCIRHVAGNMRFVRLNEGEAEGVTVLTVFMDDETHSAVPWVVGEDHDRFVRTEQGWRFKSRRWTQLFARPAPGAHQPMAIDSSNGTQTSATS
jgi:NAD(P)-dependent dehydrogenase (short-subunit alcohol dehydrogenase family)